jgi:hypothetical protein
MGSITIPRLTEDNQNVYWDGTELLVTPEEEAEILASGFILPDGAEWMTRADVSGGEGAYISRLTVFNYFNEAELNSINTTRKNENIGLKYFTEAELKKLSLADIKIFGLLDDFEAGTATDEDGNILYFPASDSILFSEDEVSVEVYNLDDLLKIGDKTIGYGLFIE